MLPDLDALIKTVGLLGVWGIVFAESGLLIGFFLPGDSLLFTAGFLASQGFLNLPLLCVGCFAAAVAGDSVGYAFGSRVGRRLFQRDDSIFFHRNNLLRAEVFYQQHGKKAIILARFIPVVRTFAPIVAGMGHMEYRTFLAYNLVGGAVWGIGVPLAGYQLGSMIPDIDRYLLPIIGLIIIVSLAPPALHLGKEYLAQRERSR
jgi:membrane-associated protein